MGQTLTNLRVHIIFSTKDRLPQIVPESKERLHAYLGGILRELRCPGLAINGTNDHVHVLAGVHQSMSISDLVRTLKSNSSGWMHDTFPGSGAFGWQNGYGAFSVSQSNVSKVIEYIHTQEEHHRVKSFKEEFLDFLRVHEIEYDPKYIWL